MRVISGIAGGRQLKTLKSEKTRPTTDRVKEAVFNILGDKTAGCTFLDLYAGTGNIGIEALSRGACKAFFVEKKREACRVIRENLKQTGFLSQSTVWQQDVFKAMVQLSSTQMKFDLIYIDPPYHQMVAPSVLTMISACSLITVAGLVIIESSSRLPFPENVAPFGLVKRNVYGDTLITFCRLTVNTCD